MKNFQKVKNAKQGEIITLYKEYDYIPDTIEYFAKISDYGRVTNCLMLESADIISKYGKNSLGTANSCLKLTGKANCFEVAALNNLGKSFIKTLKDDFNFCNNIEYCEEYIRGELDPARKTIDENERLKLKTHADIIRTIAFKFKPVEKKIIPYAGLFGAIAYDFIDQFEDLPQNTTDVINDPDYELFFVDNLFLIDHANKKTLFIANALITDNNREQIYSDCMEKISFYETCLNYPAPVIKERETINHKISVDTNKKEFITQVKKIKKHIYEGDIFQGVLSRMIISNYNALPFTIYKKLKSINPSPYMFYINDGNGVLLGSSPEMFLKVEGNDEKYVEIRPIAGTKPRGIVDGNIDPDLDSKYEIALKLDTKELAEHTMLIDLARNDIARISKTGTRSVYEPFIVEKYSHVQHIVSKVSGILRDDLDALHAYLASMNMGTLTGAPKIEAMKLLRIYEKTKRGFYGGSVGYITPSKDMDSCIVIRSIRIKGDKAFIRVGAGIVYDSVPQKEFEETEKKADACLEAIKLAGGLK